MRPWLRSPSIGWLKRRQKPKGMFQTFWELEMLCRAQSELPILASRQFRFTGSPGVCSVCILPESQHFTTSIKLLWFLLGVELIPVYAMALLLEGH